MLFPVLILLLIVTPVVLLVLGIVFLANGDKKKGKLCFILMGIYLLISFGICGLILADFSLDTR